MEVTKARGILGNTRQGYSSLISVVAYEVGTASHGTCVQLCSSHGNVHSGKWFSHLVINACRLANAAASTASPSCVVNPCSYSFGRCSSILDCDLSTCMSTRGENRVKGEL